MKVVYAMNYGMRALSVGIAMRCGSVMRKAEVMTRDEIAKMRLESEGGK